MLQTVKLCLLFSLGKIFMKTLQALGCDRAIIIYLRLNIKKLNPECTLLAFTLTCYKGAQDDTEDEQSRDF